LNTLGALYQEMGRFDDAEPLLREALEVSHLTLGKDHPTVAVALGNLAGILKRLGRRQEAILMLRESLDLLQRTVGPEDLSYARTALFLARVHASLGEESAAEPLIEPALAVLRASLDPAHPRYLYSLEALAAAFRQGQRLATAERWLRAAADLRRQILGEGHPDAIGGLLELAALQQERGDGQDADATLEQALETLPQSVSGEAAVRKLQVLSELTGLAIGRGDRNLAERRYRALRVAFGGATLLNDPDRAVLLGRSATLALALGETDEARQTAQQAAELQLRFLAEGYPLPATSLAETGLACSRTGLLDLARSVLSRALPLLHQSLGDEHELCIGCQEALTAVNDRNSRPGMME
jgi:tetratricopeptide (TPR) repeat protein